MSTFKDDEDLKKEVEEGFNKYVFVEINDE